MTQQPQEGFHRSAEDAREWMKAVQEQLQINDDTRGPRAALEARLRETEKICQREPEGRVKVDLVLQAAEVLLACCPEDRKPAILAQLRDIKAQWEETVTYMTHCHSRIEWVWLHWSEYLLARDEFCRWFQKMMVVLAPPVELQLGLKEKQWQLSHAQVLLHNVDNQAVLLDRLLEEAASLFNRIGDPSVDEDAQKRMKAEYDAVKAKAQDRVGLLEQVTREHEQFQAGVDEFQRWLQAVVEKVNGCMGRNCKLTTKHRLSALQDIAKDFPRGDESLKRLEEEAVGVIHNTSPLGAEKITRELEEMREVLEKLRVLWEEEEGRLRSLQQSKGAFERRRKQLEAELGEFRKGLQRLAEEGLEPVAPAGTEDELVARWRLYSATRAALAAEEPQVDRLQAQLKELIVFPHDLQQLPDSVVAAIQEFQSMKGKSTRLRNATGVELWRRFQRPLQDLQLWRALAQRLLEVTASLPDLPSIHTFLPQIQPHQTSAAAEHRSGLREEKYLQQQHPGRWGSHQPHDAQFQSSPSGRSSPGSRRLPPAPEGLRAVAAGGKRQAGETHRHGNCQGRGRQGQSNEAADTAFSRAADWTPKDPAVARPRRPLPEGVLRGAAPAAAPPAAAAPAAAAPRGRGRPQLHAGQQLRPLLHAHAPLQWPAAHLVPWAHR
ncbi:nesprin-3 isoform X8 [Molossus molossus]|uniref:nesprin-3 isoform X8 n=1 Tax=Molossus molossus TaxID=27622 RepID=UPI0017462A7E|nr:nesprin-3 isoform X8 [Molossus molossus]